VVHHLGSCLSVRREWRSLTRGAVKLLDERLLGTLSGSDGVDVEAAHHSLVDLMEARLSLDSRLPLRGRGRTRSARSINTLRWTRAASGQQPLREGPSRAKGLGRRRRRVIEMRVGDWSLRARRVAVLTQN
jgi:hypothetical protein